MASSSDEPSKKRALDNTKQDDAELGPAEPKRAKLQEVEDDDSFGPAMPTASSSASGDTGSWARVRLEAEVGEVTALDKLLTGSDRAEWMTLLPPEKRESREMDFKKLQQNVTSFSKRGIERRGDTSSWTDTPADRAARESGDARMSSLEMAKQLAAERFKREEEQAAQATVAAFNSEHRSLSLYEQVKQGLISKDAKKADADSRSDSDSESSSSSEEERRSHKHKRSKDKHRHKDKHKDKDRHKEKRKSKDKKKKKDKKKDYDDQTPKALSTADAHVSGGAYWDRERDLVGFGARASEQKRKETFRDAGLLNSRFASGGTSTGPSNLR